MHSPAQSISLIPPRQAVSVVIEILNSAPTIASVLDAPSEIRSSLLSLFLPLLAYRSLCSRSPTHVDKATTLPCHSLSADFFAVRNETAISPFSFPTMIRARPLSSTRQLGRCMLISILIRTRICRRRVGAEKPPSHSPNQTRLPAPRTRLYSPRRKQPIIPGFKLTLDLASRRSFGYLAGSQFRLLENGPRLVYVV